VVIAACVLALAVLGLASEAVGAGSPTVTAVWPRSGPPAGGTPVTIVGSGFSAGTVTVTVDGNPVSSVNVISDTVLKVAAPSLPTGATPTGVVAVTTPLGTSASTSSLNTYTYRTGPSLAVPAYFYALTPSWGTLDGPPRTADLAILNPASGPGSSADPNYVQQVAASQAAGVDVVGYVNTSYGGRSLSSVEADISRYEQWYHVNGIFLDQTATSCSTEASYYAPLYAFVHAQPGLDLTVLNPGATVPACYMAASDVVMTYEGTAAGLASGVHTVPGYDPSRFWGVVYSAPASALSANLATLASDGFGEVFVTDQNLPNPYGVLPGYWSQEVADVGTTSPPAAPAVTGISPNTGPAAGGTQVTISGSNLSAGTVAFGATSATGVVCTASSCTATAPAGSGTVDVRVTTTGGTSAIVSADQFTYQAPPGPANLIPDPGFETTAVPADYWGSTLARSGAVVHSGSAALTQTLSSSSGGWELDLNSGWYAPLSSSKTYTTSIWVRATAKVSVDVNLDLLGSGGAYVDSVSGPWVTLTPNTWTQLTLTGIKPTASETEGVVEADFQQGSTGTVIYWDDMAVTSP
jgi:hypothetical protein